MNVTKPSETVTLFLMFASSYDLSLRCLLCLSLYIFTGTLTWKKLMSTLGEGGHGVLKKKSGRNNMHQVLEGLVPRPM